MSHSSADGPEALSGIVDVSRETTERLEAYVALIRKWQPAENLIAPSTLDTIWSRHVADSAELVRLFPDDRRWLDIGTGAGFPGMVVAILGGAGTHVDLIESNRRKCAFLRQAIGAIGAPATVREGRAEALLSGWSGPVDRIAARAVAPLTVLLKLAAPLMTAGVPAAFHKGADYPREVAEARKTWGFDLQVHPSRIGSGAILAIANLSNDLGQTAESE